MVNEPIDCERIRGEHLELARGLVPVSCEPEDPHSLKLNKIKAKSDKTSDFALGPPKRMVSFALREHEAERGPPGPCKLDAWIFVLLALVILPCVLFMRKWPV